MLLAFEMDDDSVLEACWGQACWEREMARSGLLTSLLAQWGCSSTMSMSKCACPFLPRPRPNLPPTAHRPQPAFSLGSVRSKTLQDSHIVHPSKRLHSPSPRRHIRSSLTAQCQGKQDVAEPLLDVPSFSPHSHAYSISMRAVDHASMAVVGGASTSLMR